MRNVLQGEECIGGVLATLRTMPLSQSISPEALQLLTPEGFRPVVELQERGHRKRPTDSLETWSPESGEIHIYFVPDSTSQRAANAFPDDKEIERNHRASKDDELAPSTPSRSRVNENQSGLHQAEAELCDALAEVERLGRSFVALTWFRDDVLPSKGFAWAADADERQAVLARTVEKGLVLTSKIPNPRSPYPTTTIRLNRSRMRDAVGERRFSPVRIQGESLSSTIHRDRGSR